MKDVSIAIRGRLCVHYDTRWLYFLPKLNILTVGVLYISIVSKNELAFIIIKTKM